MAETQLDEIIAALEGDGMYVDRSVAGSIDAGALEKIHANLAELEEQGLPTFVVVGDWRGIGDLGPLRNAVPRVHDRTGVDGLYLGVTIANDPPDGRPEYRVDMRVWGEKSKAADLDTWDVTAIDQLEPRLGPGLERLTEALISYSDPADLPDLGAWNQYRDDVSTARQQSLTGQDDGGGVFGGDGGPGTGVVLGGVLLLVVIAVLIARGRKARAQAAASARPARKQAYALPPSAVELVRAATEARVVTRGRTALLELGEAVDAAELTPRGDTGAWQAALDHYDAARRVLRPEEPVDDISLLDGVGGLVLAERGMAALRSAQRGRGFEPASPCFLNPLHGEGTVRRDVDTGRSRMRAPLCARCSRDLKRGARPEILDVLVDGEPRHYFESGAEPWASTGYGALQPDLIVALQRTRR